MHKCIKTGSNERYSARLNDVSLNRTVWEPANNDFAIGENYSASRLSPPNIRSIYAAKP